MIRTYRIFIERELGDALSCAAYLKEGREDVLRRIITTPDLDINEKMFEKYDTEYVTSYIYLEELKAQMENDYLGEIKQHCNCEWSLVYSTRELTVTVDDTGYDDETLDQLFAENGYERLA